MKIKNINLLTLGLIFFVVSCSNGNEVVSEEPSGPVYRGPYHIEFLACSAGPDYSQEQAQKMLSEWKELDHSDELRWAGVHAPEGDNNRFDNGWWELEWTSKEAADEAWASENPEFMAWAQKYESVISCDGEGRYPWTFYLPRPSDSFGAVEAEDGYYASAYIACSFNEGYESKDLRAAVVEYNNYLDNGIDVGPYYFGVYYPEFDADDDFLWLNAHASFEGMAAGNADWEVNGKDMQARFNEISTCRSPDIYNSWMLRSVEE